MENFLVKIFDLVAMKKIDVCLSDKLLKVLNNRIESVSGKKNPSDIAIVCANVSS